MNYEISTLSILFIVLDMVVGIAIPIVALLILKRKKKCQIKPFLFGMLGMFLFAMVLEQLVHLGVGKAVPILLDRNHYWISGLYGGLMAGLFEETARFLIMTVFLKKCYENDANAFMYGVGHGGFEMAVILVLGMINNLVLAVMIKTGNVETLLNGLPEETLFTMQQGLQLLCDTNPFMFLVAVWERISAFTAQIALSYIVWQGVKNKKLLWFFPLAIVLHMVLDTISVVLNGMGMPVVLIEVFVSVMALCIVAVAIGTSKLSKKNKSL